MNEDKTVHGPYIQFMVSVHGFEVLSSTETFGVLFQTIDFVSCGTNFGQTFRTVHYITKVNSPQQNTN